MVVPYLVGKLSQPVRLQQQGRVEEREESKRGEEEGRRAKTKPSMRDTWVGFSVKQGKKKNVKMGNLKKQNKQSEWRRSFSQMLVWSFKAARNQITPVSDAHILTRVRSHAVDAQ